MRITNQDLLDAAEENQWKIRFLCLIDQDRLKASRDGVNLYWNRRGRVSATLWRGSVRMGYLRLRSEVLAVLESPRESLRPAVAYAQAALGGTVIEHTPQGHHEHRFIEPPQNTAALREHLAADHGANPVAVDRLFVGPTLIRQQHDLWHQVFQAPAWPYVNPHHHVDMRTLSAATLLETT